MRGKIAACRAVPVNWMAGKGTVICGVFQRRKRWHGSWERCADDVQGGFDEVTLSNIEQHRNGTKANECYRPHLLSLNNSYIFGEVKKRKRRAQ